MRHLFHVGSEVSSFVSQGTGCRTNERTNNSNVDHGSNTFLFFGFTKQEKEEEKEMRPPSQPESPIVQLTQMNNRLAAKQKKKIHVMKKFCIESKLLTIYETERIAWYLI